MSHLPISVTNPSEDNIGLAAWMNRVATELDRKQQILNQDNVHDLRVALRRCMSIADVHMALDPLDAWRDMRKAGRSLFKRLGGLRDVQVMSEWIGLLAEEQDSAGMQLKAYLAAREAVLHLGAAEAMGSFDGKKWLKWRDRLAKRSFPLAPEDPVYRQFALERWQAAHDLHRQALRNRSHAAFHRLRIGLKRFRYTIENFLPQHHALWGADLKLLQDALGEHHDLFVLWQTGLQIGALADRELRLCWRGRIEVVSGSRLLTYRSKTVGKDSLWPVWRAGLPRDPELEPAAEARIRIWASYRDPSPARTRNGADLALQVFDGFVREGIVVPAEPAELRSALYAAAIMRNVGVDADDKNAGKSSYRQIKKTESPFGFPAQSYELAKLAVRYRKGLPGKSQNKHMATLTEAQRQSLQLVAAILCLTDALAGQGEKPIRHVEVSRMTDALLISAEGYSEDGTLARKLAAARYPLEVACHAPVLIRPLTK